MDIQPFQFVLPTKKHLKDFPISNPNIGTAAVGNTGTFQDIIKSANPLIKFEENKNEGIIYQNINPSFCIYQQIKNKQIYTGLICLVNVLEVEKGTIIPHEEVLENRAQIMADYLKKFKIQAEPINLVTENLYLEKLFAVTCKNEPKVSFTQNDITHKIWVLSSEQSKKTRTQLKDLQEVMIADGHHRFAATLKNHKLAPSIHTPFVLSYISTPNHIKIFPYHRKFTTNKSQRNRIEQFLKERKFKELQSPPDHLTNNEVLFYINKKYFFKNVALFGDETIYTLLTKRIFNPILDIHNIKKSESISFFPGEKNINEIEIPTDNENQIVVFMPALSYHQILSLAKRKISLPPKSSWILPKLLTGLTIYDGNF